MRCAVFAIVCLALASVAATAQDRTQLPDIVVGAPPPAGDKHRAGAGASANDPAGRKFERCVDVGIGSEQSMGCINEKLKREVDRVNPPVTNTPPIDARSPDLKVGVVNVPAVQQQYGKNFGVSAFPFRPPPPVFSGPMGANAHR